MKGSSWVKYEAAGKTYVAPVVLLCHAGTVRSPLRVLGTFILGISSS